MNIVELIQHVGPDHIELQNLQENFHAANMRKGVGQITFNCAPQRIVDMSRDSESDFVGIVMWLPRARLPNLAEKKEDPPPQPKPCPCGCTTPEVKGNGIGDFYVECPQCHRRSDQIGCEWSNHAVERWNNDHLEGQDYDG